MKRSNFCLLAIFIIITGMNACNKTNSPTTITVTPTFKDSLIGTYKVVSAVVTVYGIPIVQEVQDSGCLSDNEVKIDSTTISFIDAGVSCGIDYGGNWSLRNDSLRLTGVHYKGDSTLITTWDNLDQIHYCPEADGGNIVSFDGTTLILSGSPALNTTDTTKWVKL